MECRAGGETDDYIYLDPKLLKGGDVQPKNRAAFQDAIVFIVGGGNYIEYQNLADFIKVTKFMFILKILILFLKFIPPALFLQSKTNSNSTRRIIYGASTLNNANQFVKQLSLLGQEISDIK